MYKIGFIGCGDRAGAHLHELAKHPDFKVTAIADPRMEELKPRFDSSVAFYPCAEEMLANEELDGIIIATRCSTHTPLALLAAQYGKPILLEKPVGINREQLEQLSELLKIPGLDERVVVSFPLRYTEVLRQVKKLLEAGEIGTVEHVQAWNNPYNGRGFFHKWYRDENETGGLFIQKATHDMDYIKYLLGENMPVRVCAMKSKQIFKGDMPAGQKCADCPKRESCPESDLNVATYGPRSYTTLGEYCCFATDTGNEDSGSVIVMYESGLHVVYSQNFASRKDAASRGARLIGYKGTIEFCFDTGLIRVLYHNECKTGSYQINATGGHNGGDYHLMKNFTDVVRGKAVSVAPLSQGILSAKVCVSAKLSSTDHRFYDVDTVSPV